LVAKYKWNLIFDPDEIVVGIDLAVETRKFIATKVQEALICARGDAEKAGVLLRVPTATINRVCRTWGIDRESIREETKIPIEISYIYGV